MSSSSIKPTFCRKHHSYRSLWLVTSASPPLPSHGASLSYFSSTTTGHSTIRCSHCSKMNSILCWTSASWARASAKSLTSLHREWTSIRRLYRLDKSSRPRMVRSKNRGKFIIKFKRVEVIVLPFLQVDTIAVVDCRTLYSAGLSLLHRGNHFVPESCERFVKC